MKKMKSLAPSPLPPVPASGAIGRAVKVAAAYAHHPPALRLDQDIARMRRPRGGKGPRNMGE